MVNVERTSDPGTFQPSWVFSGVDSGEPVRIPAFADKSYGMWGSWGSGKMQLEGSWDKGTAPAESSWIILKESDNTTAISDLAANACGVVLENPIWIRPKCTTAVTSITVVLNCTLSPGAK